MTSRITFIDQNITDFQSLIPQLPSDSKVVILNANKDGVMQILSALQGKTKFDAIDIISHGAPGTLMLGSTELSTNNLADYHLQLMKIGQYLTADGDILLYGCEVAQGKIGQRFIEQLSQLTSADVAASTNLTGAAELGGDWILAAQIGTIQSNAMQLAYSGILATLTGTNGNDVLPGTGGNDTFTGGLGNDTLNGDNGIDIAIFSGNKADYEFSLNVSGLITVRDINLANGNEGIDTLSSIGIARFTDGDIKIKAPFEEFLVNTHQPSGQQNPSIAALADGGFVVSWQSNGQDGSLGGIYAQRYDVNGAKQGSEFLVNTHTAGNQIHPSIAALANGGFVVSWQSDGQDGSLGGIYAQRYDANGAKQGNEFLVNDTHTAGDQIHPSIAALANGGFVVSWESGPGQDGQKFGIYAQRYDANGLKQGNELSVNTVTKGSQHFSSITALSTGGFVVSWQSEAQDGNGYGIYAQRYDGNGVPQGGEFKVNTHTLGAQTNPSIAALTDGGFVVSWQSNNQDGSGYGIYAQRYNANGTKQDTELPVNSHTDMHQSDPSITALTDGGFVVSWQSNVQDGSGYGVYAQRYDVNGLKQGNEFRINTYTTNDQFQPTITALADGGFVTSWLSGNVNDYGIYAQRYDAAGNRVDYLQLEGTATADHLKVAATTVSPAFLLGMDGNDVLQGGGSNDMLYGGAGNDTLTGGIGIDTMLGGLGNDNYVIDNAGDIITENLGEGTDKVSSNVTYTLPVNIENLTLTGTSAINGIGNILANVITGNNAANQLNGQAGNDTLNGGAGNDELNGGAGNDILNGGTGTNTLTGGTGNDSFRFASASHNDTIADYNVANDTIQLENAVFTALTTVGTLAADQFRVGTQALDNNDFVIYNNVTGALLYDSDGNGVTGATQIAILSAGLTMTNVEFVVI